VGKDGIWSFEASEACGKEQSLVILRYNRTKI